MLIRLATGANEEDRNGVPNIDSERSQGLSKELQNRDMRSAVRP